MDQGNRESHTTVKTVTIGRPGEEVYQALVDLSFLPRFVEHLESVRREASGRWRWMYRGAADGSDEGQVEVEEDRPGEHLRWLWYKKDELQGRGEVLLRAAPGNRGTEVTVGLAYDPPGGTPGRWLLKLMGAEPRQQLTRDLYRLRQLLETGEIATTVGQPAARESTGGELLTAVGQPSGRSEP